MRSPNCIDGGHRECSGTVELVAESRTRPCSCSCHRSRKATRPTSATSVDEVQRRSGGRCEARVPDVCRGRAVLRHHVRRRSQGGDDSPANLLDLCSPCHEWIHAHPALARELGLLRSGARR